MTNNAKANYNMSYNNKKGCTMNNTNTINNYHAIIANFLSHHPNVTMTTDHGTEIMACNGEYIAVGAEQDDGCTVGYTYATYPNANAMTNREYDCIDGSDTLATLAAALESWHDTISKRKD